MSIPGSGSSPWWWSELCFQAPTYPVVSNMMSLEFMSMLIFFMLICLYHFNSLDSYVTLFYLVFSACEGALGLGLIVHVVRSSGNDLFKNISPVQW